jgi:hypothetical protein
MKGGGWGVGGGGYYFWGVQGGLWGRGVRVAGEEALDVSGSGARADVLRKDGAGPGSGAGRAGLRVFAAFSVFNAEPRP